MNVPKANDNGEEEIDGSSMDQSNSSGSRPTDQSTSSGVNREQDAAAEIAARENRVVAFGRRCMIALLLVVAAGASVAVYKFTAKEQEKEFKRSFEDLADQLLSTYEVNAANIVEAYETFALQVSAFSEGVNAVWPFVTIPSFEAIASRLMEQTGALTMVMSHFVTPQVRDDWDTYTAKNAYGWINESCSYYATYNRSECPSFNPVMYNSSRVVAVTSPQPGYDHYAPVWQVSPISRIQDLSNWELLSYSYYANVYDQIITKNSPMMSEVTNIQSESEWPRSFISYPIYNKVAQNKSIDSMVATVSSVFPWDHYFTDIPLVSYGDIFMVVTNTCNQTMTYVINGQNVTYIGPGDFHDPSYNHLEIETTFSPMAVEMDCMYSISVYPSKAIEDEFITQRPIAYTGAVIVIFAFTIGVFLLYETFVEQRQDKVMSTAQRSTAIVSSLFPQQVADKLMGEAAVSKKPQVPTESPFFRNQNEFHDDQDIFPQHIAELFPSTTVMFADIVGFTAWSSEREPSQVFELLEHIYSSFDHIAKRKRVFKVETIGDCYMAAAGIPDKRPDHAIVMARFARDCLKKMLQVVRKLESFLGPSTGELGLRIGMHSGPVTAGVLRGDKARFQLFGDTVNIAARMESTGWKNKIQVSAETATLINKGKNSGREICAVPREDQVPIKGKGNLTTYWLTFSNIGDGRSCTTTSSIEGGKSENLTESNESDGDSINEMLKDSEQEKLERSIEWTATVLQRLLRQVVAMRGGLNEASFEQPLRDAASRPLDEVVEMINLNRQQRSYPIDPNEVELPSEVLVELRDYIRKIAKMYHRNFFHNFEHAIHVTLSVTKLLARVVTPNSDGDNINQVMHEYTFGITSDPLALFSVAFSALIHDVDHPGVPNATLVMEGTDNAKFYNNQSVAEQNSVDLAWDLLAEPSYSALRGCIYSNQDEFDRFRQLVVNTVMATDIVDKKLGAARKARWQKAFAAPLVAERISEEEAVHDANRKATIVLEHIIQASDVSHTMQHWHIFVRWNERFFFECYQGYLTGRTEKDPSVNWYESELGFFDYYVIPLAKKLKDCQVFGVSSEEYLNYAMVNRKEWEAKGQDLVKSYIGKFYAQSTNTRKK